MADQINGFDITNFKGGVNAEALFVNGNPVVSVSASNVVLIGELADFPEPVGGIITLENNTLYQIPSNVDISSNVIEYGVNSVIEGFGLLISSLTTSSASPLLSGDVVVRNITLFAIAPIVVDGTTLDCDRLSVTGHTTGILINNSSQASIADLDTFDGDTTVKITGTTNQFIEIRGGTYADFTVAGIDLTGSITQVIIIDGIIFSGASGDSLKGDAGSANVSGGGVVGDCAFVGSADALDGITKKDLLWRFSSNIGVQDSQDLGAMEQIANLASTTLITGVAVQLAGIFSASAPIERFNVSSNMLVAEVEGDGIATISMDGGGASGGAVESYDIVLLQNGTPDAVFRNINVDTAAGSIGLEVPVTWAVSDNFAIGVRRQSGVRNWLTENATLFIR